MIGTSTPEYVFIRACIAGLRLITPLSILYCVCLPAIAIPSRSRIPLWISIWPIAETAFYLLFYLPRRWILQRPAIHPDSLPQPMRKALFNQCIKHVPDPEYYLRKWFKDAPLSEIKCENLKEFYRWSFLNKGAGVANPTNDVDLELEEYVQKFEEYTGHKLEPGYGKARPIRLTFDKVDMVHRPLVWYLVSPLQSMRQRALRMLIILQIVFLVDNMTHLSMLYHGFKYHRTSIIRFPTVFPPRPLTLITTKRSPVKILSYWLRPHTSKTKLPIVFLHGIGIGLWPYVNFLAALNNRGNDGGEVGIIAIEILPISFRITHSALGKEEMCRQIENILLRHGFESFVLVTHSCVLLPCLETSVNFSLLRYGSFIGTHLLKDPAISTKIASVVLVDPPTILLHLPDVCYNFVCLNISNCLNPSSPSLLIVQH
jgi:hypothetical protein